MMTEFELKGLETATDIAETAFRESINKFAKTLLQRIIRRYFDLYIQNIYK